LVTPRLAMLILRNGKPVRAVARDNEARQMCNTLDSIVEESARSPVSHDWMDRLGMIRFEGTFRVRGAEIVGVTPTIIDLTLHDEPSVLALAPAPDAPAPNAQAASDDLISVGPFSDDEAASDANSAVPI